MHRLPDYTSVSLKKGHKDWMALVASRKARTSRKLINNSRPKIFEVESSGEYKDDWYGDDRKQTGLARSRYLVSVDQVGDEILD